MLPSPAEITYFLEVSNTLNLSRAAERLGISQPSLSNAILRLEETVGTPLLIRHKKGVNLTQAGKQFFNHGRQLMQQWEDLKSKALESTQQIQGYFTLGCHPSVAKYSLPFFLPNLIKNYPYLEIQLKHDISRRITEEVISLAIDVAIVVNPVKHPDLIICKLFQDRVTLWHNEKLIQSVRNVPLICDLELPQPQRILKELKKQNSQYRRTLISNNLDVVATLTANGCGIGVLPERIVMSTYPTLLKPIAKAPVCYDDICLIYRHENRNVMAIQKIISEIKKLMK